MQWTQNFLIFTKFVSPLEKPRKRPQEIENQKDIEQSSFLMQFPGSKSAHLGTTGAQYQVCHAWRTMCFAPP
jgi:hypothetical protein